MLWLWTLCFSSSSPPPHRECSLPEKMEAVVYSARPDMESGWCVSGTRWASSAQPPEIVLTSLLPPQLLSGTVDMARCLPDNDVIFWVHLKLDLVPWINSGHGNGGSNNNNHNKNGVTVILGTWNGIGGPLLSKSQTCLQLNVWNRPFSWIDQTVIVLNIVNLCYPVQWASFLTCPEAETAASNSLPII